jgi:hypothetical protein
MCLILCLYIHVRVLIHVIVLMFTIISCFLSVTLPAHFQGFQNVPATGDFVVYFHIFGG